MKIVLLIGQSNMAGRGFINEVPPIHNERIQMFHNGAWQVMTEPIHCDKPVAGVGPAASFAEKWCEGNRSETIGLIPCAQGGTSLDKWSITGNLFCEAVKQTKKAMQDGELIGILWHQGESDSYDGRHQTYYKKLLVIVETLRKELNAPEIPFMIGGLPDFLGKFSEGVKYTEHEIINEELKRFAFEQENCYFVTAEGLTSNPDGLHIDAVSQRKFGVRYYKAFAKKQHLLKEERDLL